ncbi:reticulon 2 (Z-band associated protein) [Chelydra serpentina]|uniref:Reticulon n=1 Tax=Chelydra serpentina TaxID=8475 RepID=A0A8T1RZ15_CHESE|nr:reticulon 2 (Z-band associated protein) [Chelydra serpentina]
MTAWRTSPACASLPRVRRHCWPGSARGWNPFGWVPREYGSCSPAPGVGTGEPQVVPVEGGHCPPLFGEAEQPGALTAHSEAAPETAPGDGPRPKALMPCAAGGTPGLGSQHPPQTSAAPSPREGELEPQEEGEQADTEPITEQQLDGLDQSGNTLGVCVIVADLVYWRDTRTSALVLTGIMVTLLSLLHFSIVSVGSYGALAMLGITITLRLGRKALQALRRSDGANPFQAQLDAELPLSQEQLERLTARFSRDFLAAAHTLRRLFLVEDLVDSIKFAFLFYILTYVGAVFNGLTLLILGVISAFTFPLLYRQHQAQIDQYVGLVRNQLSNLRAKIQAKLPSAKAKPE